MSFNRHLFSSASGEWETPAVLFRQLDQEFRFTLDACAHPGNYKVANFYGPADEWDGLAQPWTGVVWCNPPYGRSIVKWVEKGYLAAKAGATVVMLLPSRTDTRWWHDYVMKASEIRFIRGRLKFGNAMNGAPFPSAIVVFRSEAQLPFAPPAPGSPHPALDGAILPVEAAAVPGVATLGADPRATLDATSQPASLFGGMDGSEIGGIAPASLFSHKPIIPRSMLHNH